MAGTAVLLLRQNKQLAVNSLKVALQFTSRLLPLTDVLTQGAGALNIQGALKLAAAINPDVPHGKNWIRHRLTASNLDASGNAIRWSRRIIYGDRFVRPQFAERHLARWDDTLVWAYDAIADNIVWGNDGNIVWGNVAGDNIVWGNDETDNLVWGVDDNIVWGNADNIVWGNSDDDNIVWGNSHLREVWAAERGVGLLGRQHRLGQYHARHRQTTSSGVTTPTTSCGATAPRPTATTSSGATATKHRLG